MSAPTISRVKFYCDLLLSLLNLVFGRVYSKPLPPAADLTGKIAIVTGANSGIGLNIAIELVRNNAIVYLACRNASKAREAVFQIISAVPNSADRVETLLLDTSSLSSVRECAERWKKSKSSIDILIHNAGSPTTPHGQPFTVDGLPMLYATNLLGSFLLTNLLEPWLSHRARIIFTSSTGQYAGKFTSTFSLGTVKNRLEPGFHAPIAAVKADGIAADSALYSNTKAMQVAFAKLLYNRWNAVAKANGTRNQRVAHAFTPGFTMTPIFGKAKPCTIWEDPAIWVLKATLILATEVSWGAATGVWLATTEDEAVTGEGMGGGYWDRMTRRVAKVDLMSTEQLERFWIRWEADAGIVWK